MKKYILLATALLISTNTDAATTSRPSTTTHMVTGVAVGMAIGSANSNRSNGFMVGECPNPNLAVVMECYAKERGMRGVWAYQGCSNESIESEFMRAAPTLLDTQRWEIRAVFDTNKNKWYVTGCGVNK